MQIDWSRQELTSEQLEAKLQQFLDSEQMLMSLNLSDNLISDLSPLYRVLQSQYVCNTLKILNLSTNKLSHVNIKKLPGLFSLDLSYNENIHDVSFEEVPSLKMIDLRFCAIDDVSLLNIMQSSIKPKNLRLQGNKITDLGIQTLIDNKFLHEKLLNLTSLELKNTLTQKYFQINQIVKELPQQNKPKQVLAPIGNDSRHSSARSVSGALGQIKKKTINDYLEQLDKVHNEAIQKQQLSKEMDKQLQENQQAQEIVEQTYPQSLVETLVGNKYKIFREVPEMCAQAHVCVALTVGVKLQNDLEEAIAYGFARKVGTIFCKDKKGSQYDCRQRCGIVLSLIQKKISDLDEQQQKINDQKEFSGTNATGGDLGLVVIGKGFK
ncbi:Conserved_hypothetical protein [Hexamita inflata]|uniref:Uncharacterized protein n=1 Tax=Hexamita inflata TaxID=28002 RepID=A0AA86RHV9_9EUKA|nr:Conserved hypothetical protein [Hexamita inflata]